MYPSNINKKYLREQITTLENRLSNLKIDLNKSTDKDFLCALGFESFLSFIRIIEDLNDRLQNFDILDEKK